MRFRATRNLLLKIAADKKNVEFEGQQFLLVNSLLFITKTFYHSRCTRHSTQTKSVTEFTNIVLLTSVKGPSQLKLFSTKSFEL